MKKDEERLREKVAAEVEAERRKMREALDKRYAEYQRTKSHGAGQEEQSQE